MFSCKYKLELEDCLISAKYVYKSQKRKQDKFVAALLPILMVCMVAMLIIDLVNHRSFVWDIVLLAALVVLEVIYLIIPLTLTRSQKKSFKQQNLASMDYLLITIDDTLCTETMFKDGEEKAKSPHSLKQLTSYIEDNTRLILVFNKIEFVCLRKANLEGDLNKLKAHLEKCMSKSIKRK